MLFCRAATVRPKALVDRAHPGRVATGQVVVDGHQVHTAPGERIQVDRHGGDQRLALAGLHLGDGALVKRDRAHDLHVERTHARSAPGRLARYREGLGQQVIECLAFGKTGLELRGLGPQAFVGQRSDGVLQRRHAGHDLLQHLELLALAEVEEFIDYIRHVAPPSSAACRSARSSHRAGGTPLPSRWSRSS